MTEQQDSEYHHMRMRVAMMEYALIELRLKQERLAMERAPRGWIYSLFHPEAVPSGVDTTHW